MEIHLTYYIRPYHRRYDTDMSRRR